MKRTASPSLYWSAWVAFGCIVGAFAVLLIVCMVRVASAAPRILSGDEATQACRAQCGGTDYIFVERELMLQFLRDRGDMIDELEKTKRELETERKKPRCGL